MIWPRVGAGRGAQKERDRAKPIVQEADTIICENGEAGAEEGQTHGDKELLFCTWLEAQYKLRK